MDNEEVVQITERKSHKEKTSGKTLLFDVLICIASGIIVGFAFHCFSNPNDFAPGGVNGLASMAGYLFGVNMGYFSVMLNLPIFILVFIFVAKKTSVMLIIYMATQSLTLILLEQFGFPVYKTETNMIMACIATGIVSGFGFSLMLRRFGASGGTYAISSLIKRFHPEKNLAWVAFAMDASVVVFSFFVYGMKIEPVLCTLINLVIATYVVDYFLQGLKMGYRFEIVTDKPEELAQELMTELGHGVTEVRVKGMYSNSDKYELICIIRRRQMGDIMKILKRYPGTFSSVSKVNEVFGRFKK